jgi:aminoglycoside 3-N-acetyltransferase
MEIRGPKTEKKQKQKTCRGVSPRPRPYKIMSEQEYRKNIIAQLQACGLERGDVVLVHSSLKSLGQVPGGPATVINGLLDAVGSQGTLLMPAVSYKYVTAEHPVFDVLKTPSNVGAITEFFRNLPSTIRSIHPTHSVCGQGLRAAEFLKSHQLDDTPCGGHSPYRLLSLCNGKILFLGCGLKPNTSMHGAEEITEPPYLFGGKITYRIIHANGSATSAALRSHNFSGWVQRYDRVENILDGHALKTGMVLAAKVHLVQATVLWEKAVAAMRKDPFYFVEKILP